MFGGTHPRTTRALRLGIAAMGVSALLATFTGTASADDPADNPGGATTQAVTATPSTDGAPTLFAKDGTPMGVGKITLTTDSGDKLRAFCIDLHTPIQVGETYVEGDWDTANPQSDMRHILWVLDHSIPNVSVDDLLAAAHTDLARGDDDHVDDIVYMATQAAVWHFSDGFEPSRTKRVKKEVTPADFTALLSIYDYLTGPTNTGMTEPAPTLSITPESLSGEVGKAIGPFTVHTTAESIALSSPEGAKIVDENGDPVTSTTNGKTFSVVLDKPGKATVQATGSATLPEGRIFVYQKAPDERQKLVLAQPSKTEVKATVTVEATQVAATSPAPTPTASPKPQPRPALANTGASPWPKVGIAVALLAVGTGLVLLARRRRSA